jgi:tryptophanyl-tRNA synthetase
MIQRTSARTRAVTGMKPTGAPHLGNYLGMIRPVLRLAEDHDMFCFVADLHALTVTPDPDELMRRSREVAATFLACGLDPARSTLYRQSDVPEVAELTVILANVTPKGLLNRSHAYKAAIDANLARDRDPDTGVSAGLFTYPVLMAADILLPGAEVVPVGRDQKQHLEVTRDVARAFNARYGDVLTVPEAVMDRDAETVVGTDGEKMSKSRGNVIPILAAEEEVRSAAGRIVTDSRRPEEPKDPETDTVYALYRLVADPADAEDMRRGYLEGGLGYAVAKKQLADVLVERFGPARALYEDLLGDPGEIERILAEGAARVRASAVETLSTVRGAVGLPRLSA